MSDKYFARPLFLSPVLFLLLKKFLWQTHGSYVVYNRVDFSWLTLPYSFATPFLYLILAAWQSAHEFSGPLAIPALVASSAMIGAFALSKGFRNILSRALEIPRAPIWILLGCLMTAATAFPYVLVRQLLHFSRIGPILMTEATSSRHHFPTLIGFSIAWVATLAWSSQKVRFSRILSQLLLAFSILGGAHVELKNGMLERSHMKVFE
jgi:hypothetical protein